jgi:hypothetical protein
VIRARQAAIACFLAGLPLRTAFAVEANATAGVGYGRWDTWIADQHSTSSMPDWQGSLDLSGRPFRPGLLEWRAGVSYQAVRNYYAAQSSTRDGWGLRLQSAFLSGTPLPITISAGRSWTDFATDSGTRLTGSTLTNSLNLAIIFRKRFYPTLRLQGTWINTANHAPGGTKTDTDSKTMNVGMTHTTGTQTYAVDYSTAWNSGNFAINNYRSDYLNAQFTSTPSENVLVRFREYYLLRNPTNDVALNPRFDDNNLSAGVQWRPGSRWNSALDYNFRHALVTAKGAPRNEQTGHSLTNLTYLRLRPTLAFFGTTTLGFADQRLEDQRVRAGNQRLGAGVNGQIKVGRTNFLLSGSGQGAFIETQDTPFSLGYVLSQSSGFTHMRERMNLGLQVSLSYASNAVGVGGTTFSQTVQAMTEGVVGKGTYLRGTLSYNGSRRDDPVLGMSQTRTLTLVARAAWRRWNTLWAADFSGGQSDALAEALVAPEIAPADPLVVSQAYNTRSRYATLQLSQSLLRSKLAITELLRILNLQMPGGPGQYEEAGMLTVRYQVGAVTLSLEDRLSRGGSIGPAQTVNVLMVRLSRAFGARF